MCEEINLRSIIPSPIGLSFVGSVEDLCKQIRTFELNRCLTCCGITSVIMNVISCASFGMFGNVLLDCLVSAHHLSTSCESAKGPGAFPHFIVFTEVINFLSEHSSLIV